MEIETKKPVVSEIKTEVNSTEVETLTDAFSNQLLNIEDIDSEDLDNPQLVSEYVNDIYKYLRFLEVNINFTALFHLTSSYVVIVVIVLCNIEI